MNLDFAASQATPSLGRPLRVLGPGALGSPLPFQGFPGSPGSSFGYTTTTAALARVASLTAQVVSPEWATPQEWADQFVAAMMPFMVLPRLMEESRFQEWAGFVIQDPLFMGLQLPDPIPDWKQWAEQVNQILGSISSQ